MSILHSLLLLFSLFFTLSLADVKITIVNKCNHSIWPGLEGQPRPTPAGFHLYAGGSRTISVKDGITAARVWARTGCSGTDGSSFKCVTGDCGNTINCLGRGGKPPMSLAEFTLAKNGYDIYDISFVDGSNVPVTMIPNAGTFKTLSNDAYDCKLSGLCNKDLRQIVAEEMKVKVDGKVVATQSACTATNNDRYCCRKQFDKPETCKIKEFPSKYYADIRHNCPTAYFYAYDDVKSTFACRPASGRSSPDYTITFCHTK